MPPRIAIPVPHSTDSEYAERAFPQYVHAVEMAGGEPVRIPLDQSPADVMKLIELSHAVLLPGSKADIDPTKYHSLRDDRTAPADPARDIVDDLLLREAYNLRKPILGICYGLQILNVFRGGTLLQHIESPVNHEAGRDVRIAHNIEVDSGSKVGRIVAPGQERKARFRRSQLQSPPISARNRRRTPRRGPMSAGWNHRGGGGNISRSLCHSSAMAPGTFSRR